MMTNELVCLYMSMSQEPHF